MKPTLDVPSLTLSARPGQRSEAAPRLEDPRVLEVVEEYLAAKQAGQRPDRQAFLARHPDLGPALADCLDGLDLIENVAPLLHPFGPRSLDRAAETLLPEGALGDYRLVREIGRGGMGVVYEAVQMSLGRRVALKVLPFAAALDGKQLQRFKNEAQAASHLHHQHIVPVYGVGCDRGVHHYSMQFIDGQTLAALIHELRPPTGLTTGPHEAPTGPYTPGPAAPAAPVDPTAAPSVAALTTELPTSGPARFRTLARLGVQAAEGLEHAHALGVIHRDIKPANLMVDRRGQLWITDFGLAHCQSQAGLTMTGDLVGTLRYMSPEQALAQRVLVDQRTDIYSLGATLYELLTLEPVFAGSDRQELLRQIAFEEPRGLRRLDQAIPAELETIVLKALEKNPSDRYASAQELADDLERYLKDEPLRAKRPTLVQRTRKWSRRHRSLVWATAACALMAALALGGSIGWIVGDREARRAANAQLVESALQLATDLLDKGKWLEARAAVRRVEGLHEGGGASEELSQRVRALQVDLAMVVKLEEILIKKTAVKDNAFDWKQADPLYAQAFREYGVDVEKLDSLAAANRLRARSIRGALAGALDDWALTCKSGRNQNDLTWKHLLNVARATDPDPWRNQFRHALDQGERKSLQQLAASAPVPDLPPLTLFCLATSLKTTGALTDELALLRRAQERYPADFWINHELGYCLKTMESPQWDEALRFLTVAAALRPQSPGVQVNLGNALCGKGRLDEAIAAYRRAIGLQPGYANAHNGLGLALLKKALPDQAIAAFHEAIRLQPDYAMAHSNLGNALREKGQLDAAIAACKEAIRLQPGYAEAYCNLGEALRVKGQLDAAITAYYAAIRLKPTLAEAHNNLANALWDQGQREAAIAAYHAAVRLRPNYALGYNNLGYALWATGQLDAAIAALREAIRLQPTMAKAHNNLGLTLRDQGHLDAAIAAFHEALRLEPDYAFPHNNLGLTLRDQGHLDAAIAAYHEALRLKPHYAEAHCNLGSALQDQGQLEAAIAAFQEAIRHQPNLAVAHYNLGNARGATGQLDAAIAAYHAAIRFHPNYAEVHCNLGHALRQKGQFSEALAALRRGHALGSKASKWHYPSARWVTDCERLVVLDGQLPAILNGQVAARGAAECIEFAKLCELKRRYAAAVQCYEKAFAAEPKFTAGPRLAHRYNAACAAALAGCGKGQDAATLHDKERARLRQQALDWLRADLNAWRQLLDKQPNQISSLVRKQMRLWQHDADFVAVRGSDALSRLPEPERQPWQQLWKEVEELRKALAARGSLRADLLSRSVPGE